MRLLKLGIYPRIYLQDFYQKRPELKTQPYSVQHQALIADCFGSADFWTGALSKLGYETADVIANAKNLQSAWAGENAFDFDENNWLFEIARAQIKQFRPNVLLIADYSTFTADFLKNIRRECDSIRLVLGWCGAPYADSRVFREWDIALSCVPEMVRDFERQGVRSFHVNHAFAPKILNQLDLQTEPNVDFAFVGSIVKQNQFHLERERLLLELVETTQLQIWSDLKLPTFEQRAKDFVRKIVKRKSTISENYINARIASRTNSPVFGIKMFQQLRNSRVVFNNHIDISPVSASNMRLFETTGVGACLLTDWRANLSELFEPDQEVLTYRSAAECAEKLKYILAHEPARRQIAQAGQKRALREHNFDNRAAKIDEIICSRL